MSRNKFLSLLFDEGHTSCFSDSPHGYKVSHYPGPKDTFFCINALHPYRDLNPTKDWHREDLPRRADSNVVCFRNFLIELDTEPLSAQIAYVRDKIPVSSIVYSGSKSHHFIISLTEPVLDYQNYMNIARRLLLLFPEADPTCKNPSRLSRLPFAIRPETNKTQELIYLGNRIPVTEILPLLPQLPEPKIYTASTSPDKQFISALIIQAVIEPEQTMAEKGLRGRNQFFFYLGNRLKDALLDENKKLRYIEMAYSNLKDTEGFSFEEALTAARVRDH
jgi:hypothetical protein